MVFPKHGSSQKGKAAHEHDGLTSRTSVTLRRVGPISGGYHNSHRQGVGREENGGCAPSRDFREGARRTADTRADSAFTPPVA